MNTKINKRLFAFIIDWISLIIVSFFILFIYIGIKQQFSSQIIIWITVFVFLIAILKDIIGGASIGKRVFNLYIGNQNKPTQPVKKYKLILRNCTYILWPIEGILLLTTGKRIGDRITNTIVYSKQESNQCRPPQNNPLFR